MILFTFHLTCILSVDFFLFNVSLVLSQQTSNFLPSIFLIFSFFSALTFLKVIHLLFKRESANHLNQSPATTTPKSTTITTMGMMMRSQRVPKRRKLIWSFQLERLKWKNLVMLKILMTIPKTPKLIISLKVCQVKFNDIFLRKHLLSFSFSR